MPTHFLNRKKLWQRIPALAKKTPNAVVVVASCGVDSPSLLPLRKDSTLIVDASPATVKAGATCPFALESFRRRGINVYSVEHLHAKIFLFGRRVLIGSSNVSTNSARLLEEAAVESTEPRVLNDVKIYIRALDMKPLGPDELWQLGRIYQPPRFNFTGAKLRGKNPGIWLLPLDEDMDEEDRQQAALGRPKAKRRMTSAAFKMHEFSYFVHRFIREVERNQRAIQIVRPNKGPIRVYRDGIIVDMRRYKKKDGTKSIIIYLEIKNQSRNLNQIKRKHPEFAKALVKISKLNKPKFDRSSETRQALKILWPASICS